jgi:hypothetical protein
MPTVPLDPDPATELAELAGQVRRLRPDWNRMDGYYEQRSELAAGLMRLARRLDRRPPAAPLRIVPTVPARASYTPPPPRPHREPVPAPTPPCSLAVAARPRRRSRRHRYPKPGSDPRQPSLFT